MKDLIIKIRLRDDGNGYVCSDNVTAAIGIDPSPHGALLEWVAEAVKLGAFEDDSTPLLRPLRLVWPTDYSKYTQRFGANPDLYARWGLPGHEGVDIRAPHGSNVYAAAAGVVSEAKRRKPDHPYGYCIRLRHVCDDGEYETLYAHLIDGSAKVDVGDVVQAGQLIGLADETGNVLPPDRRGAHLHFGLKKIGSKNGGYGELINPEPFFVDGPRLT